jgi:hypothetical protein
MFSKAPGRALLAPTPATNGRSASCAVEGGAAQQRGEAQGT